LANIVVTGFVAIAINLYWFLATLARLYLRCTPSVATKLSDRLIVGIGSFIAAETQKAIERTGVSRRA
jgi:hypothetical protein